MLAGARKGIVLGSWAEFGAVGKIMISRSVKPGQKSIAIGPKCAQGAPCAPQENAKVHTSGSKDQGRRPIIKEIDLSTNQFIPQT